MLGKLEFKDEAISFEDWKAIKPTTKWGQCPVLTTPQGKEMTQSKAIARYLGKVVSVGGRKLYPDDPALAFEIDEMIDAFEDVRMKLVPTFAIKDQAEKLEKRAALFAEGGDCAKLLAQIETFVGNEYTVGGVFTLADVWSFFIMSFMRSGFIDGIPSDVNETYPKIGAIASRVAEIPEVKAYSRAKAQANPLYKPMVPSIEFGYWKIRGLGAIFRMLLEYKEASYTDRQYATGEEWFGGRKPAIMKQNALANLPYVVDGAKVVCQTNALADYLGSKFAMNGADEAAQLKNSQLLCEIMDVRNGMIELVYPFKQANRSQEEFDASAAKKCEGNPFAKFEACLNLWGTDFFCGPSPCVCDFHIWEMLDQHRMLAEKISKAGFLDKTPKCQAFHARFRALPTLQKYFESEAYKLPLNNPIAGPYFM